jgi:hypothetical protein
LKSRSHQIPDMPAAWSINKSDRRISRSPDTTVKSTGRPTSTSDSPAPAAECDCSPRSGRLRRWDRCRTRRSRLDWGLAQVAPDACNAYSSGSDPTTGVADDAPDRVGPAVRFEPPRSIPTLRTIVLDPPSPPPSRSAGSWPGSTILASIGSVKIRSTVPSGTRRSRKSQHSTRMRAGSLASGSRSRSGGGTAPVAVPHRND